MDSSADVIDSVFTFTENGHLVFDKNETAHAANGVDEATSCRRHATARGTAVLEERQPSTQQRLPRVGARIILRGGVAAYYLTCRPRYDLACGSVSAKWSRLWWCLAPGCSWLAVTSPYIYRTMRWWR